MQSPKFRFVQREIRNIFYSGALKITWKKKIRHQIRRQALFDPIEYRDFDQDIDRIAALIERHTLDAVYTPRAAKRYLVEKSRGLCRQMTMPHPVDLLVLEILSQSVYSELKASKPSKGAFFEPDDGNFFKKTKFNIETEYGAFASWKRFQKEVFGFARENNYIVITDVANFYDFISFRHLRNIVSSLCKITESRLDLLIYVLNKLTWVPDYMPHSEVGMPQLEASAPRVLANAMLYEVDRVAEHMSVSNYARFMDDIDIGVDSVSQAKLVVRNIDLSLQARQLRLNSSKTKILRRKEAFDHYCIKENSILNWYEGIVHRHKPASPIILAAGTTLGQRYEAWWDRQPDGSPNERGRFRRGNGNKLLKWTLRLLRQCGRDVPSSDLLWLIRNDPSLRPTAFHYLTFSKKRNTDAAEVFKFLSKQGFVCDISLIHLTSYLLHARFRDTPPFRALVNKAVPLLAANENVGHICALYLLSKFGQNADIIQFASNNLIRIRADYWASRVYAGCAARFFRNPAMLGDFLLLLRSLDSDAVEGVFKYLSSIAQTTAAANSALPYLVASNHSLAQGIYFPKVLVALAAKSNVGFSANFKKVENAHKCLSGDPFFKSMGF